MTKAINKIKEPRVLFLLWVGDPKHLAKVCAGRLWNKLDGIAEDRLKRPLNLRELIALDEPGKAGREASDPTYYATLEEVTDVVNFFSDEFFRTAKHLSEKSAMSVFLDRKEQEARAKFDDTAGKDSTVRPRDSVRARTLLYLWGIPVQSVCYDDYPILSNNPHYWHYLVSGDKPLHPADETILREELHAAAQTLLTHHPGDCARCKSNTTAASTTARKIRGR